MHAIITGGSSGIGLELARLCVLNGYDVSLVARDESALRVACEKLQQLGPGRVNAVSADVRRMDALREAFEQCERAFDVCDLLITSAGIVEPAFFEELVPLHFEMQMDVNFSGTVNAVRAIYAGMKSRGSGSIMMISSAAAFIGIPGYSAYCASKAALAAFAESLRSEVGAGIHVGISFPPDTCTPQLLNELPKRPPLAKVLMGDTSPWSVETVARQIFDGISRRRREVHFGLKLKVLAMLGGFIKPVLYWQLKRSVLLQARKC
ncbi:SDR family NAD(P)-dependent oxidoreductase [Agrobacterium sp. NPDC089420]|uniref:SDR family NAD(P)-dependent oxidoreductase n=1 Tax=Agrobacterium sp. NPDC089420 TaxID=3363918 RepID=UPI00384C5239